MPTNQIDAAIFGGYGVFGGRVAKALAPKARLRIVGRSGERAREFAAKLGDGHDGAGHDGAGADIADRRQCLAAIGDARVVVNCAGPFSKFTGELVELCHETGRCYVDIAEGREHAKAIERWHDRFVAAGLTAAYGCSSLPSVSCALAVAAGDGFPDRIATVRSVLFIGHDNPKGSGAVKGAADQIGRRIETPHGALIGFKRPERLTLPPPLGERRVYDFDSPDYDLLPPLLDLAPTARVSVKVGFEFWGVNALFGAAARFAPALGRGLLPKLAAAAPITRKLGTSVGAVMTEIIGDSGAHRQMVALARSDGQRLAALPAAYCAERLLCLDGQTPAAPGVWPGFQVIGAHKLLSRLAADGISILFREGSGEFLTWAFRSAKGNACRGATGPLW